MSRTTLSIFITMSNKSRLPSSKLGARRQRRRSSKTLRSFYSPYHTETVQSVSHCLWLTGAGGDL